jgi:hypothetical protein
MKLPTRTGSRPACAMVASPGAEDTTLGPHCAHDTPAPKPDHAAMGRPMRGARVQRTAAMGLLILFAGLGALPAGQAAAAVYRCADGVYADKPCSGGQALALQPAPGAQRVLQAQQVAQREQALASALEAERKARQQAALVGGPARIGHPSPAWMQAPSTRPRSGDTGVERQDRAHRPGHAAAASHRKGPRHASREADATGTRAGSRLAPATAAPADKPSSR